MKKIIKLFLINFIMIILSFTAYSQSQLPAPILFSPNNNDLYVWESAALYWSNVDNATQYNVQIWNLNDTIYNEFITTNAFDPPVNFELCVQYWWRVKAIGDGINYFDSEWSETFTFTTYYDLIYETCDVNTGNMAVVVVNHENEFSLSIGDYIEFVYQTDQGNWVCGGYSEYTNVNNTPITVWGNNTMTLYKDGYDVGEPFHIQVWKITYYRIFTNISANYTYGSDTYQINGVSYINPILIDTTQTINFNSGWNQISSFVSMQNQNLDSVFAPIIQNIVIVKNDLGQFYIPSLNINQIGNWNNSDGYMVYISNPSSLNLAGHILFPDMNVLELPIGWSLIPYYSDLPKPPNQAFYYILNSLVIVKNNYGQICIPSLGINTIGNLQPGEAYWVYLSNAINFNYPASIMSY